jgi:hypothetical protein
LYRVHDTLSRKGREKGTDLFLCPKKYKPWTIATTLPGWDAIAQAMQAMMMLTGAGSAENKSPFTPFATSSKKRKWRFIERFYSPASGAKARLA